VGGVTARRSRKAYTAAEKPGMSLKGGEFRLIPSPADADS
jgi:hypothetical protein